MGESEERTGQTEEMGIAREIGPAFMSCGAAPASAIAVAPPARRDWPAI